MKILIPADFSTLSKVAVHYAAATAKKLKAEITDGIDASIADVKADMLTMFTHDLTFLEKLFGKSVTREMAFHTGIPLLTIKKQIQMKPILVPIDHTRCSQNANYYPSQI